MNPLGKVNRWRWYGRVPVKVAIFGLTLLIVCFPYPRMLIRDVSRWMDPDRLVEPDQPRLQPWLAELRAHLPPDATDREKLRFVQQFVYDKVPYEWDWNTWGMADYLPTVSEVLDKGKEDCDGRAVVAASLLRDLGYDAHLVNDLTHVWVRTEVGDTMSPGKAPVVTRTAEGRRLRLPSLLESLRAVGVGIAIFPASRELIIVGVLWLLLIRPGIGWRYGAAGAVLIAAALVLLRRGGDLHEPLVALQILGTACLMGSVALLFVRGTMTARRARSASTPVAPSGCPLDSRV